MKSSSPRPVYNYSDKPEVATFEVHIVSVIQRAFHWINKVHCSVLNSKTI